MTERQVSPNFTTWPTVNDDDPDCRNCGKAVQNWGEASMSGACRIHWVHPVSRSSDCYPGRPDSPVAVPVRKENT